MRVLPSSSAAAGVAFTIADFIEAGSEKLQLEVVVGGSGLSRTIEEPIVYRPGLALTGFFENYAWERMQILGNAEHAYIEHLGEKAWLTRFKKLLEHKAYLFVFTDGHRPSKAICALAEKAGAVLLSTSLKTRVFGKMASFVLDVLGAPRTSIYGTMVEVCGLGVLFEGDPGLGKSETALGLIKRGYALVADDLTCIRKEVASNILYGSASDSTAGYMEIRGIGIMHVPSIFGVASVRGEKRLQLVITFKRLNDIRSDIDRIGQTRQSRSILGVEIPNIIIPVSEGRDLINLVETAAQQHKLSLSGYDSVGVLSQRLHKRAKQREEKGQRNVRKINA